MIYVKSATAWKEYAHIPSISDKLEKAGFLKNRVKQAIAAIKKKTNAVEQVYGGEDTMPLSTESIGSNLKRRGKYSLGYYRYFKNTIDRDIGGYNQNKILPNVGRNTRLLIKNITGVKLNNRNKQDIRLHEHIEKIFPENTIFTGHTTHNSPSVLVQEARIYNQTGGDNFRRNNMLTKIRKLSNPNIDEHSFVNNSLNKYKDITGRIRSKAYKKATRDLNKQIKGWRDYSRELNNTEDDYARLYGGK